MRQQSLELRDESLSYKTEKSVIHVRQQKLEKLKLKGTFTNL